jgi:hypothetical protein
LLNHDFENIHNDKDIVDGAEVFPKVYKTSLISFATIQYGRKNEDGGFLLVLTIFY